MSFTDATHGYEKVILVSKKVKSYYSQSLYDQPCQPVVKPLSSVGQSTMRKLCGSTNSPYKYKFVQTFLVGLWHFTLHYTSSVFHLVAILLLSLVLCACLGFQLSTEA